MSVTDAADPTTTVLRGFNRTYTQRIGALEDSFLGRGRALASSRLLFEVGPGTDGVPVASLRERLDLDSGYLSRLLTGLEGEGLLELRPDPADRRRRRAVLTPAGREEWAELDRRSEELAQRLVDPLTPRQRDRLAAALATADLLVRAATVRLEERPPDDVRVVEAVTAYVAELDRRFPQGFDTGTGQDVAVDPGGHYLVAVSDDRTVAVGGVRTLPDLPGEPAAEIKRMWVDPAWRGSGLGSRVLAELESLAARLGHRRVLLDTNRTLTEALALYERAGYREVARYNDNPYAEAFFEKRL